MGWNMSSYDRRLLYQHFFELHNIDSTEDELPFVTRESVRQAMGRINEPAVWHTTGLNPNDIRPEDYIFYNSPRSIMIDSDNEELRDLRESMRYNIQNQRNQNHYIINDYWTDFTSSLSTELEKLVEKMRDDEFNLEPKPNKKTLSNPRLSPKEGTDDL